MKTTNTKNSFGLVLEILNVEGIYSVKKTCILCFFDWVFIMKLTGVVTESFQVLIVG